MSSQPPANDPHGNDWSDKKSDAPRRLYSADDRPAPKKSGAGAIGTVLAAILIVGFIGLRIWLRTGNGSSGGATASQNLAIAKSNADVTLQNMRNSTNAGEMEKAIPIAVSDAKQLQSLDSGNAQAAANLAELLKASECLALYKKAEAAFGEGSADASLPLFEAAIAKYDKVGTIWYDYVDALLDLERTDDAMQICQRGIKVLPTDTLVHLAFGRVYNATGQPDEACKHFKLSTNNNERQTLGWYFWGETLLAQDKDAEAEQKLEKAVALERSSSGILNLYGISLLNQGKYERAADAFKQAAAINPKSPFILLNWSMALDGRKDLPGAIAKIKLALELAPEDEDLLEQLADYETRLKAGDAPAPAPETPAPAPAPAAE